MNECQLILAYALLLGLLAAFCGFTAAITTTSWWLLRDDSLVSKVGLWQVCEKRNGKCFPFSEIGKMADTKLDVIRTLMLTAVVMSGLAVVTSCVTPFTSSMKRVFPTFIAMEACFAAFAGLFGAAGITVTMFDSPTMFDFAGGNKKHFTYDWSFYTAGVSSLVALCISILAIILLTYACSTSRPTYTGAAITSPSGSVRHRHPSSGGSVYSFMMTTENVEYMNMLHKQRESLQLLSASNLARSNSARSGTQLWRSNSARSGTQLSRPNSAQSGTQLWRSNSGRSSRMRGSLMRNSSDYQDEIPTLNDANEGDEQLMEMTSVRATEHQSSSKVATLTHLSQKEDHDIHPQICPQSEKLQE